MIRVCAIPAERITLILGAPRSGTSWVAKIFDSHPDVLYRHEPDTVLRDYELPWMCTPDDVAVYRDLAQAYLRRLLNIANSKSAGSLPVFPKRYRGAAAHWLHNGIIYGLRAVEMATGFPRLTRNIRIPDMVDFSAHPELRLVLKTVSARGRARLFAEAMPGAKIVFVLRDPYGQVASMMRGVALGKFEDKVPVQELLGTTQAQRYGLTLDRFQALPEVEQYAWNWAILNEKAIDDLTGIDRVKLVRYQDLCDDPPRVAREMFAFAGLDWNPQSEDFVRRSTNFDGRERYYQVFKNTAAVRDRWRDQLTQEEQRRIEAVVRTTSFNLGFGAYLTHAGFTAP